VKGSKSVMRALAVNTCDCGQDNCFHSKTSIICLCADDVDEQMILKRLRVEYEIEAIDLSERLTARLWEKVENELRIFEAGKQLASEMKR
jgi:hypothetical protein